MSQISDHSMFSLLPDRRPPWKEFVFSMGTQGLALLMVIWFAVTHPEIILPPAHDYHAIELVPTPVPVPREPAPLKVIPAPRTVAQLPEPKPDVLRLPAETPKVKAKTEEVQAPKVEMAVSKQPAPVAPTTPVIPRQLVKTNVFSNGSSATPTIAAAPQQVQTGGFGDPNGVPARENNGKPVNIAQLGAYELPTGPGYGNGTGGSRGMRGVVASAGFGNGVATGDGSGSVNTTRGTGVVRQGGFGDAEPVAASTAPKPKPVEAAPRVVPAEITSKPAPAYTDEARKLRVEGEVLLEVVFEASGKLRVVRVVRGLGHGLDESAVQAAEQIRFKPALRDGQPADFSAVLHIVFQLA
jgi:TonB family protein